MELHGTGGCLWVRMLQVTGFGGVVSCFGIEGLLVLGSEWLLVMLFSVELGGLRLLRFFRLVNRSIWRLGDFVLEGSVYVVVENGGFAYKGVRLMV